MSMDSSPPAVTNRSEPDKAKANDHGSNRETSMVWEPFQLVTPSGRVDVEGAFGLTCVHSIKGGRGDPGGAIGAATPPFTNQLEELTVRDGKSYTDGADCETRVDNTLSRVHRYLLGRDSSTFQHMFDLPTQNYMTSQLVEGQTDKNLIRLYGESPERFRALLSVLYDPPLQLQLYSTPSADVTWLLSIAEISNKSIKTWAVNSLHNVVSGLHGPPQLQYGLGHCTSVWMNRLLEVALLCGHTALRDYVAGRWVDRIVTRDLRPVHTLDVADRNRIRRLQGYAYYVQLLEMDDASEPGMTEDGKDYSRSAAAFVIGGPNGNEHAAPSGTPASLTREQRERLLFGFRSLSRLWDKLRKNALPIEQLDGCTNHEQGCVLTWTQVWRDVGKSEATLKRPVEDVLGRLRAMEQQLFTNVETQAYLSRTMTRQCKRAAYKVVEATIAEVQEDLVDHFTYCESIEVAEAAARNPTIVTCILHVAP